MTAALYGEGGFYASGGGAGRDRDFLTSPELGPLFGAVVARMLDAEWERCGRPDPWVVVEGGAGSGALAAAVLAAGPACAPALRYVAVEASAPLRLAAADRLRLEDPTQVLGPHAPPDPDDPAPGALPAQGPLVTTLAELPVGTFPGVVIANELLDNLPFDIYQRREDGWDEVRVGWDGSRWVEVLQPGDPTIAATLTELARDAPAGGRVPWENMARGWVTRARELLDRGSVVVIDYGRTTAEIAAAGGEWLRTYRRGGRGGPPLEDLGSQDITADVAVDQLGPVDRQSTQAEWLRRHGIGRLRDEAVANWREGAAAGDLPALRARSRVGEADALCDPTGLGGFVVLEWEIGPRPQ